MSSIITEVIVIAMLLVVNGVFSMSELAVMTAKRSRLEHRVEEAGDAGAQAALDLAAHPTAFLSTVQVGITLVGVLAGAFGGAGIAEVLAEQLRTITWLAPYAKTVAFTLVVASITYLSLIIGELVPKRVALSNPERVAALIARPMRQVARVGGPLVRFLTASTNFVLRLLGLGTVTEPGVTELDIRALVEQGAESGAVQEAEREIVDNTFRLGDKAVDALMTPRPDIQWVDIDDEPNALRAQLVHGAREHVLVCTDDIDHVVGILDTRDLLAHTLTDQPLTADALRSLAREPLYVPATMPALRLLESLRHTRSTTAVVLDEYGAVSGLVTLVHVLEALVGELPTTAAMQTPDFARQPDGSWLVNGATPLVDVESRLDLEATDRERAEVVTMAGFVMARLGHVPQPGQHFSWEGRRVEVVRMVGRRVDTVRVFTPTRSDDGPAESTPQPA